MTSQSKKTYIRSRISCYLWQKSRLTGNTQFLESFQKVYGEVEDSANDFSTCNQQVQINDIASNLFSLQRRILDTAHEVVNEFDRSSSSIASPCLSNVETTSVDSIEKLRVTLEAGRELGVTKVFSILMGPYEDVSVLNSSEARSLQISGGSEMRRSTWAKVAMTQRTAIQRLTKVLPRE